MGQLGEDSRYAKAILDDPIAAEQMAAQADLDKKWTPAPQGFTLMHEMVAEVRDLLGEACALLADHPVAVKQRHKPPPQFPRPKTAFDLALARRRREAEEAYDAKITDFAEAAKRRWRENHGVGDERPEVGAAPGLGDPPPGDAGG